MAEGIFNGAIWLPGPKWKAGYTVFGRTSQKTGVVDHSAEGPFQATINVLNSLRTASWHFTVSTIELLSEDSLLARVYQHYPITDVCWHAGFEANKRCVGIEHCGRKDEPLTEPQYQATLALHRWLREQGVLTVCERRVDLWEHNEWMATDCPSGRIPWDRLIADLKEEEVPGFTEAQEERIKEIVEWCDPGLEEKARLAVAAACLAAGSAALTGDWKNLKANVRGIEIVAGFWNRWQDEI